MVDTLTRFAIGSVTKQFTCAVILQLAAEGRLSIEDHVAKWFPDLTRANDITLRDLMNHVSGYPDYYPLDFIDRRMLAPIGADSVIHWYGRMPLDFEPGSRYSYSNTGFIILGRIAERVTGRPIERLLRERLFQPLGLTSTRYDPPRRDGHDAQGYAAFALADQAPAIPEGRGWAGSAGAIWSTPRDLMRWDLALMEGRVVGAEWLRQMTTPRTLTGGAVSGYGFGLGLGRAAGDSVWAHSGGVSGFISQNIMVPRTRSAVVVLSNFEGMVSMGPLVRMALVLAPPPPPDTTHHAAPAQPVAPVPVIAGPPSSEVATTLFRQFQQGHVDRSLLGEEYSWFLTDARLASTSARLAALGEPTRIEPGSPAERGGMEVTVTRFVFANKTLGGLMYRTPDGKVQEFLISAQ
jgi:CubicO group peptidase (beta-lactamase class C family)